jgi:hypothetical protein
VDLHRQLELLRRKVARIDEKYSAPVHVVPQPGALPFESREVETPLGKHMQVFKAWPQLHMHGNADVGALAELPPDLLAVLGGDDRIEAPAARWAFLDTETTGLAGGSGTIAFLIGVGAISGRGFELTQYFIREFGEEPSALEALAAHLESFDVLVTYNGKAYDQPLLETRFRMSRQKPPFARLKHVDLLFAARRLWKLALERCKLTDLESRILGFERVNDVGGAVIPQLFFEYVRTRNLRPLWPVFTHNAYDILSLACLAAIVPAAFRDPERLKSAEEMIGLARWLRNEERLEEALALMRRAVNRRIAEPLLYETLWHIAEMERKLGRDDAALAVYTEISTTTNAYRGKAYERLAIHYEHKEKNALMALEMTQAALRISDSENLRKRAGRLLKKASTPKSGRLL